MTLVWLPPMVPGQQGLRTTLRMNHIDGVEVGGAQ